MEEEKSRNPIRALDPSCAGWGKTSHSWLGFGQQRLKPQFKLDLLPLFSFNSRSSSSATSLCLSKEQSWLWLRSFQPLIGIPGENLIRGKLRQVSALHYLDSSKESRFAIGKFLFFVIGASTHMHIQKSVSAFDEYSQKIKVA